MRIDLFLSATNVLKRRQVAKDMCDKGAILINEKTCKSSRDVRIGDKISVIFLGSRVDYEVMEIPSGKNTPKRCMDEYVKKV